VPFRVAEVIITINLTNTPFKHFTEFFCFHTERVRVKWRNPAEHGRQHGGLHIFLFHQTLIITPKNDPFYHHIYFKIQISRQRLQFSNSKPGS
jgi:hypothetical protein